MKIGIVQVFQNMFEVMENLGLQYHNNLYKGIPHYQFIVSQLQPISNISRWPIGIVQVFQNMFEVMENLGLQYLNNLYKEYTTLSVYCVSATAYFWDN